MLPTWLAALALSYLVPISLADVQWPDTTFPQPVCPDCSLVICGDRLQESDCPTGTFLLTDQLLGCCPACVSYREYSQPCPGPGGREGKHVIDYLGRVSEAEHEDDYPLNYIEETVELPCSQVNVTSRHRLPERVTSVTSLDSGVPLVQSFRCAPGLECRKVTYTDPTVPISTTTTTTTTTTTQAPFSPQYSGITSPVDGNFEDPYPICNVPAPMVVPASTTATPSVTAPEMDCANQPCTCRVMDYKLWFDAEDCTRHKWKPTCTATGMFAPMQLRESRNIYLSQNYPWCSDPEGNRLFGGAKTSEEVSNCHCSRKHWELEEAKSGVDARRDVSLHCTDTGGFEKLQCDLGNCWCVVESSGEAVSTVVPEILVHLLPCYPYEAILEESFGNQYLRKCEKRSITAAKSQDLLRAHGTEWTPSTVFSCDYDGSFGPVFHGEVMTFCKYNTGNDLGAYRVENVDAGGTNCRCARDEEDNMPGRTNCKGNGNYKPLNSDSTRDWCVDEATGWRVSNAPIRPDTGLRCCLDSSSLPPLPQWGPGGEAEFACYKADQADTPPCRDCPEEMAVCME